MAIISSVDDHESRIMEVPLVLRSSKPKGAIRSLPFIIGKINLKNLHLILPVFIYWSMYNLYIYSCNKWGIWEGGKFWVATKHGTVFDKGVWSASSQCRQLKLFLVCSHQFLSHSRGFYRRFLFRLVPNDRLRVYCQSSGNFSEAIYVYITLPFDVLWIINIIS